MNKLVGHIVPGISFFLVGLWHLFNHIKLHVLDPESYAALPWFPTSKFKYLEPLLAMLFCLLPLLKELFILLKGHQVIIFETNRWERSSQYSNRLAVIEHNSIYLALFINAAFAVIIDRARVRARYGLTLFLSAVAYAQGLFLIHFHSSNYNMHTGPEGQHHLLFQLLLLVCLATILIGIALPKSFMVSFVRSLSICFQGVWLIFMGVMLWTPALLPEGCVLQKYDVVMCSGEEAIHRAKSLINLEFSWFFIGIAIFGVSLYLVLDKIYGQKDDYFPLQMTEEEYFYHDAEYSQKKSEA